MNYIFGFLSGGLMASLVILVGVFLVGPNPSARTCETLAVGMPDPQHGLVYIGTIDLCGENLEWSGVEGPIKRAYDEGKWK